MQVETQWRVGQRAAYTPGPRSQSEEKIGTRPSTLLKPAKAAEAVRCLCRLRPELGRHQGEHAGGVIEVARHLGYLASSVVVNSPSAGPKDSPT